jgi:hypothetical protein
MADKSDEAKARAEAKFRKNEQRSSEAEKAHAEVAAKARARDENTARLRGLRLAKEQADREAAAGAQQAPARKTARKRSIKVEDLSSENDV